MVSLFPDKPTLRLSDSQAAAIVHVAGLSPVRGLRIPADFHLTQVLKLSTEGRNTQMPSRHGKKGRSCVVG